MSQHCICYSEEFEATNNTVELRLHLAPSYRLENGALQPISKVQIGSTTLSFDRRKTVGDLRLAIYQVTFISKNTNCCCQTLIEISISLCVYLDAGALGRRYGSDCGQESSCRSTPLQHSYR